MGETERERERVDLRGFEGRKGRGEKGGWEEEGGDETGLEKE